MNITRIISGLLGFIAVTLVLILANVYIVDVIIAIIAIMTLHEYFNAVKKKSNPIVEIGYLLAGLISVIHLISQESLFKVLIISVPIIILVLFLRIILTNMKVNITDIAVTFFGIGYIVLFLMFLSLIYGMENGKILIWFTIFIAWGTDTFAYIVGKLFGKHKFSQISPNKSIEGCIGGIVGSVILTLLFTLCINKCLGMNFSYLYIGIMSVILSIISQIGDFAASSIKRYVGIKDFSHLIPGHGGMLDRIDSLIFVAPFAYILLMFI